MYTPNPKNTQKPSTRPTHTTRSPGPRHRHRHPQFKTPEEVEVIRYANAVGSAAHAAMMRSCRPGLMEYQLEATFLHHCYSQVG